MYGDPERFTGSGGPGIKFVGARKTPYTEEDISKILAEVEKLEQEQSLMASGITEFYNQCHGEHDGKFCEGPDGPGRVRENVKKPGRDPKTGVPTGKKTAEKADTEKKTTESPSPSRISEDTLDIILETDNAQLAKSRDRVSAAIAKVHGLPGDLLVTDLTPMDPEDDALTYGTMISEENGDPIRMKVRPDGPAPEETLTHEFGHLLDNSAGLAGAGYASTSKNPAARALMDAIKASKTINAIRKEQRKQFPPDPFTNYLLSPKEMFARAYSQWIALRSGDKTLQSQIRRTRGETDLDRFQQWSDEEFAPIAEAFDTLFRENGLLHEGTTAAATPAALPNEEFHYCDKHDCETHGNWAEGSSDEPDPSQQDLTRLLNRANKAAQGEKIEKPRTAFHLEGQHDQSTHGSWAADGDQPAATGNPKKDRWVPENPRQARALRKLKAIPSEGRKNVDGEMVDDAIKGSAPFKPGFRDQFSEKEIEDAPKTTTRVPTKSIIATKNLLKRSAIAAVIHALENPKGPWFRPGYLPIAIQIDDSGDYYLYDGHHRIEGARILNQPTTEVELIDFRNRNIRASAEFHLQGQHDQSSHGNWSMGEGDIPFENRQRIADTLEIDDSITGKHLAAVIEGISMIAKKHTIPDFLPEMRVVAADLGPDTYGQYNYTENVMYLNINELEGEDAAERASTFVHEYGHYLDNHLAPFDEQWKAFAKDSKLIKNLTKEAQLTNDPEYASYVYKIIETSELWGRAYEQWVTGKGLWEERDFQPIASDIERLFRERELI